MLRKNCEMLNKMLTLFKKDWFTGDILCKIPFYHLYFYLS